MAKAIAPRRKYIARIITVGMMFVIHVDSQLINVAFILEMKDAKGRRFLMGNALVVTRLFHAIRRAVFCGVGITNTTSKI